MYHSRKSENKVSCCQSAVEEVLEPEIHIMSVGVSSLFVLKTMSLVRVKHEFKFFAEVYEFVDQLHAILQVNVIIHYSMRGVRLSSIFLKKVPSIW
jgi:hypothetical protein